MSKTLLAGLAIASSFALSAQAQSLLTAETAAPTGVPGTTVLSLSEAASKAGIADMQVTTGQTLTNSVQNVAEGKTDVAAAPFVLPFLMSRGVGPYANLGKEKGAELAANLRVLYTYRLAVQALFAYDSKNFGGYDSIEGATIFNGPPRGAALTNARNLVRLATGLEDGKGYTGIQVNWGQAVKTIQDGSSDAMVLPIAFPDGRMTQAVSSGAMTLWSLPKDIFESEGFQKIGNVPGTVTVSLTPAETAYADGITVLSEDDNFRGPGTVGGEVVNKDMSFDMAKALTKAFLDNLESVYMAKAPFMKNAWLGEVDIELTDMCKGNPLKYHPGAVAAWEEAGFTLPDCAK
ncbi:MAG: TAXI family TRAP transporter solute-binding subunit [Pseudomonadota bacterium]